MVLFKGTDSAGHDELWTTNGTAAGTTEIDPSSPTQSLGLSPAYLTVLTPGPPLPTITGTVSGQPTISEAPVKLFAHTTIGDANLGATDTLTITLDGVGGTLNDGTGFTSLTTVSQGVYSLSGTAAAITSELDALIFTPTAGAPDTTSKTTFTLSDQSSANPVPVIDTFTSVIDHDPSAPPPPVTNSILWQNASGQASIWNMGGSTLVGGGAVTPNPGPNWKAIGTGDFNGDGNSDILWRNASTGQASIWEMSGNTLIGGGAVSPNPGTSLACRRDGRFQSRRQFRHPVAEHEHRPGLDLGDEREHFDRRRGGQPQSRAGLEADRNRRFQWRRQFRHPVAEHEHRPGLDLGDEREPCNRRRGGEPQSWAELGEPIGAGDFNHDGLSDILFQNKSTWPGLDLGDEREPS